MHRTCWLRPRAGFTLVELLVALLLFDCALLALAGGAAVVIRQRGLTERRSLTRLTAENRLASLRGAGCPAPQTGSAAPGRGLREQWQVVALDSATRLIDDSVAFDLLGRHAATVLHSAHRC